MAQEIYKTEAKKAYENAFSIDLPPCSSVKLGLALNFSVFYQNILKDSKKACEITDKALNLALEKIDDLGEEEFKDAKQIIELMKENLTVWKEEPIEVQQN